jgi:hypothetical protein
MSTGIDLEENAGAFYALCDIEEMKMTNTRMEILAGKPQQKRLSHSTTLLPEQYLIGPPPYSRDDEDEEVVRIPSISDPTISSVGKELFYAASERQSELLGNALSRTLLGTIFSQNQSIEWTRGRVELPVIIWNTG